MTHHLPQMFTPLTIKDLTFKNRIWMSPMCQYSSQNGHPTPWHWVHLGSRAAGGAGLIMLEASAVSPEGRISPNDSGFWSDDHIKSFQPLVEWIKQQGAVCGIQIAHAGRKASTTAPWAGKGVLSPAEGGWQTVAPSAIAFEDPDYVPKAMNAADMDKVRKDFTEAAIRALKTGFQVLELHMAHGYLMHQFLSPASNSRTDNYGGSLENRMRFPLEIAQIVRAQWPENHPLFVRISATDWAQGPEELRTIRQDIRHSNPNAWSLQDSLIFCQELKKLGVDLIDCSSGGTFPHAKIPIGPGYQVPFAEVIRAKVDILTAAVGMITNPIQAEALLTQQQADAVFLGRELLRNPYWPNQAARAMGVTVDSPKQYLRA